MERILRIESLAPGGDGLARDEGQVVFVPLAVPGDRVLADVSVQGGAARGRLLEVLDSGADRRVPPCPVVGACGGCQWQQIADEAQLRARESVVREVLRRIGRFAEPPVQPAVASPKSWRYRRRARMQVTPTGWGFTRASSTEPIEIASCLLLEPEVERLAHEVAAALRRFGLASEVRAFVVDVLEPAPGRAARGAVFLETKQPLTTRLRAKAEKVLGAEIPGLAGLVLGPAAEEGQPSSIALLGQPVLVDAGHRGLRVRPDLFAQANRLGARLLAEAVAETIPAGASVLEVFAGSGTLSLYLAAKAGRLVATEGGGAPLELLRASLRDNALEARLVTGPAARVVAGLAEGGDVFDHVVLDPPRAGARGIVPAIARLARTGITYVSCDPATFARDARLLVDAGWRLVSATPFDLFPQTRHVELVGVFERQRWPDADASA